MIVSECSMIEGTSDARTFFVVLFEIWVDRSSEFEELSERKGSLRQRYAMRWRNNSETY